MPVPLPLAQVDPVFAIAQIISGSRNLADRGQAAVRMRAVPAIHLTAQIGRQSAAYFVIVTSVERVFPGVVLSDPLIHRKRCARDAGATTAGVEYMLKISNQSV